MSDLVYRAMQFAKARHGDQKRKYTDEPYWTHPVAVAGILEDLNAKDEVIAAAMLHDVLEDTPTSFEELDREFGHVVADLVMEVTNVSRFEDGNRAERKAKDKAHLAKSSFWGATIKLADLIDNTRTIVKHDPKFAVTYLQEKRELLRVLEHGHRFLLMYAADVLNISDVGIQYYVNPVRSMNRMK